MKNVKLASEPDMLSEQPGSPTKWRRAVIFNRTSQPVTVKLAAAGGRSKLSPEGFGAKTLAAATTFAWGLRLRQDVEADVIVGDTSVGSIILPFGNVTTASIIVDNRGAHRILAADRRPPGVPGGINRVQVGCGPANIFPDWWNIDIRQFRGIDAAVDVTQDWPYVNLDYVYGEQFLEHIDLDGALKFLASAGRSLKPGGVLRLTTPNIESVLRTHYATTDDPKDIIRGTLNMNRAFHGWGHKFLYSPVFLDTLCRKIGYTDVRIFNYGESSILDLQNLERHGGYRVRDGISNHIVLEAEVGDPKAMNDSWRPFLHDQFLKYYFGGH